MNRFNNVINQRVQRTQRAFNTNKKRLLRTLLNQKRTEANQNEFKTVKGYNTLFGTTTNQTYSIMNDLVNNTDIFLVSLEFERLETNDVLLDNLRDMFYKYKGKHINAVYLINGNDVRKGNRIIDYNYDIPNFQNRVELQNWWESHTWDWMVNSEDSIFSINDNMGKVYIKPLNSLATKEHIKQSFLDGIEHCVFKPIIDWATKLQTEHKEKLVDIMEYEDSAEKPKLIKKQKTQLQIYTGKLKRLSKLTTEYKNGVPEDKMEEICKYLTIRMNIHLPYSKTKIEYGKDIKEPFKIFDLTNTRINHLDNGVMDKHLEPIIVSQDEIYDIKYELEKRKEPVYYQKGGNGIARIFTLNKCWSISSEFWEVKKQFEEENGLRNMYIDSLKNPELASFIDRGVHYNSSIKLNHFDKEYDDNEIEIPNLFLIDQIKAYYNYFTNPFYEGFLGRITDFRETNKIQGVGLYLIDKYDSKKGNKIFNEYNKRMGCYKSNNIYFSAELKFLSSMGITYHIVAGCWGVETLDLELPEESLHKVNKSPFANKDGVLEWKGSSIYALLVGCMNRKTEYNNTYIKGNEDYANTLRQYTNNKIYYDNDNEITISIKKDTIKSLSHITAGVLAYQRISLIIQLLEMDINKIYGIYVDGIYYLEHKFKLLDTFQEKDTDSVVTYREDCFISNIYNSKPDIKYAQKRENYHVSLYIGAGGNGKTYTNLTDKGLINSIYLAPTHSQVSKNFKKFGINGMTVASVLSENPLTRDKTIGVINRDYSNIIIDEVTMISNEDKIQLIKIFPNHKLIFCGDVGYQIGCISTLEKVVTQFNNKGFDNIIELTENFRCRDKKLLDIIKEVRELIDLYKIGECVNRIPLDIVEKFQRLSKEELLTKYKVEDLIITYTNSAKDQYTALFKHLEKWCVLNKTSKFHKNDIVIGDKPPSSEIRHAFTCHSVQGDTCEDNVYIDIKTVTDLKIFYTAISRATKWSQIYMV